MVSGCPSLIQVTLVAGEAVEMQVRLDELDPWVNPRWAMLGGAGKDSILISWLLFIQNGHELDYLIDTAFVYQNCYLILIQWIVYIIDPTRYDITLFLAELLILYMDCILSPDI